MLRTAFLPPEAARPRTLGASSRRGACPACLVSRSVSRVPCPAFRVPRSVQAGTPRPLLGPRWTTPAAGLRVAAPGSAPLPATRPPRRFVLRAERAAPLPRCADNAHSTAAVVFSRCRVAGPCPTLPGCSTLPVDAMANYTGAALLAQFFPAGTRRHACHGSVTRQVPWVYNPAAACARRSVQESLDTP